MELALLWPLIAGITTVLGFCTGFALGMHLNTQVKQISISNLHDEEVTR